MAPVKLSSLAHRNDGPSLLQPPAHGGAVSLRKRNSREAGDTLIGSIFWRRTVRVAMIAVKVMSYRNANGALAYRRALR
jgi:hypothetical protein